MVKISKFRRCVFAIMLSLIGKRAALQNWIPFTQGYFAQHLVKNGQVVLEKKIFKFRSMYFRYFVIISPWKEVGPFIWINLNSHHPKMLCAKFGYKWPSGSGEEDFFNFVNVFSLFRNYLNPLHPRMLCAKSGWNWLSGFEEEDF